MDIELTDEERKTVVDALEHYDAYLHATNRKDGKAAELAERLRSPQKAGYRKPAEGVKGPKAHRRRNA